MIIIVPTIQDHTAACAMQGTHWKRTYIIALVHTNSYTHVLYIYCTLSYLCIKHNNSINWDSFYATAALTLLSLFFSVFFSDIDECVNGNKTCKQLCTNTPGSFICSCHSGFQLHIDKQSCVGWYKPFFMCLLAICRKEMH